MAMFAVTTKTASYTLAAGDTDKEFQFNSGSAMTATLPASATAGNGYSVILRNTGDGDLTVDPDGAETIDGESSMVLMKGQWAWLGNDGSSWRVLQFFADRLTYMEPVEKTGDYTVSLRDVGSLLTHNSTSNHTFTLPSVSATSWTRGNVFGFKNINDGLLTIEPNGSDAIDDGSIVVLDRNRGSLLVGDASDGLWRSVATPTALPYADPYTLLQLSMDGADASTTFVDDAQRHVVTANGNAQVDTAQKRFGTGSLLCDGTGDYLNIPSSSDWNLTDDFTIEAWIRTNGTPASDRAIVSRAVNENNWWGFYLDIASGNGLRFVQVQGGSVDISISQGATTGWSADTWYHVAISRSGNDYYLFREGSSLASSADSSSIVDLGVDLHVGGDTRASSALDIWDGWIDEVRISKAARYTSGFTVPSAPF